MSLFTVLRDDPEGLGLASLIAARNDEGVAAALNAHIVPVLGKIDLPDLTTWAAATGMRAVIEDVSLDAESPLRASALAIIDILRSSSGDIDISKPGNAGILSAWQAVGKLSVLDAASFVAYATHDTPYSVTIIGRLITANDIARTVRDDFGASLLGA
jgi:hypothetical protein